MSLDLWLLVVGSSWWPGCLCPGRRQAGRPTEQIYTTIKQSYHPKANWSPSMNPDARRLVWIRLIANQFPGFTNPDPNQRRSWNDRNVRNPKFFTDFFLLLRFPWNGQMFMRLKTLRLSKNHAKLVCVCIQSQLDSLFLNTLRQGSINKAKSFILFLHG